MPSVILTKGVREYLDYYVRFLGNNLEELRPIIGQPIGGSRINMRILVSDSGSSIELCREMLPGEVLIPCGRFNFLVQEDIINAAGSISLELPSVSGTEWVKEIMVVPKKPIHQSHRRGG